MTEPVHGLPPLLSEGLRVAVVPPPLKRDRWHTVRSASDEGGSGQLVRLSGVLDLGAARELSGKTLLACVDDLPRDYQLHDADALLGREVADVQLGPVGIISEVMRGPANDVWVIDGPYGELLLAVVDDVVSDVPSQGAIVVRMPAGTVDTDR